MATQTEKAIQSLTNDITILKERVQVLQAEIGDLSDVAIQISVIEHKLAEMTKTKELWGQRGWMILTILLSGSFSFLAVLVGVLFTYYLNSRK